MAAPVLDTTTVELSTFGQNRTLSHAGGAGSNRCARVYIGGLGAQYVTGVTYGGTAMTLLGLIQDTNAWVALYELVNPSTGTQSVVVSASAAETKSIIVRTYTGVDQVTPHDAAQNATAGGTSLSLTISLTANKIFEGIIDVRGGPTVTVGGNQTAFGSTPVTDGNNDVQVASVQSTGTSHSYSWTGSNQCALIGSTINGASAGGSSLLPLIPPRRSLGGFGF